MDSIHQTKGFYSYAIEKVCVLLIDSLDHALVFVAGSGIRQGDTPAAQNFSAAFQRIIQSFNRSLSSMDNPLYFSCQFIMG